MTINKTEKIVNPEAYIEHVSKKAKIISDTASIIASVGAGYAGSQFHPEEQAMNLIVEQFVQSGADHIEWIKTQITNFQYGSEDLNPELTELLHKMDFSAVP